MDNGPIMGEGIKRQWRETAHSPESSAEVKNKWSCTSTPHICLNGIDGDNYFCVGNNSDKRD